MDFYSRYVINRNKMKEIDKILFYMGLKTDLIWEGVNDKYDEGLEKLKAMGETELAKAIEEGKAIFLT